MDKLKNKDKDHFLIFYFLYSGLTIELDQVRTFKFNLLLDTFKKSQHHKIKYFLTP